MIVKTAVVLALCAGTCQAQTAPPADIERGRQLFMANGCYSCHGTVGQGGERSGAPRLAPEPYPFEAFKVLVRTPREAMPRYDPKYLSDEHLQAIHGYLGAQAKSPAAKDIPALQAVAR